MSSIELGRSIEVGDESPLDGESAGGDLAGTYPNPTIGTGKIVPSYLSASTPQLIASSTGIDLTSIAATDVYTVPGGKTLILTNLVIRVTAADTCTVAPTIKAGLKSSYSSIVGATALTGLTAANLAASFIEVSLKQVFQNTYAATNVVGISVTVGATAVALTGTVDLYGYLV